MEVRRARAEDLESFRAIRLEALRDSPDSFCTTLESAMKRNMESWRIQFEQTLDGGDRNTQLAFDGERCVGLAAIYRTEDSDEGELLMMWVAPASRGTGAASGLIENLVSWAAHSGMTTVVLSVTKTNLRAIRFYEKSGFVPTGRDVEIDAARGLFGLEMSRLLEE